MSTPTGNKAEDELLKASRDASSYFERFDKSNLHDAAARRSTDWLLSEEATVLDSPDYFIPMIKGLQPPDDDRGYTLLIPWPKALASCKPLYIQDLHQITRELVEGIYVFNQTPCISFEGNNDCTSTCSIPSAYHDTLIGDTMLSIDYFMKSLLHGTMIPGKDKRSKVLDEWKKFPASKTRQKFTELGLTPISQDSELGDNIYVEEKKQFTRHPPKFLDTDLANSQLQPRLSTSEDLSQQQDHMGRDMFLRYLDHVSIGLVFRQNTIQQEERFLIPEFTFDVTTSVLATLKESNPKLYCYLHSYLQKQRNFIIRHLQTKRQMAYNIQLLGFASFMIPFLVSLKKQNKIVDVSKLVPRVSKDLLRTERDLPPTLPGKESRWSPFTAENNYTCLHGGIEFHPMPHTVESSSLPMSELSKLRESATSSTEEMVSCELGGGKYYRLSLSLERYYLQTPKLPRWVHAMVTELKTQVSRQHVITESRVQDLLRKTLGPRQVSSMKNVNDLLQASIEKGLLSSVSSLLKRCTQTRLNKVDSTGLSLLHYAAINARGDVISTLVLSGCNVNQPVCDSPQHPANTFPVHLAAQSGGLNAVCCLQHYGADLGAKDSDGWSPIHYAAFHNYQAIVSHLVAVDKSFLELATSDKVQATPLFLAAQNGCFDTFKRLIDLGAMLKVTDSSNNTPVNIVVLQHHYDILQYLLDIKCSDVDCAIWEALAQMLSSTSPEHAEAAAKTLDALTRKNPDQVDQVLKYNIVSLLAQLLKKEEVLKLMAIQVLSNLSNLDAIKAALLKADAIPVVVNLLVSSNDRVQASVCVVLSDLGLSAANKESIGKAGALPHLIKLLQSEQDDVQAFACACVGILCVEQASNQNQVAELSGIPILISLLQSKQTCLQGCAASALQHVITNNTSNQHSALKDGAVAPLVTLLRARDPPVHNSAASAIEALAENCEQAQKELMEHPACINLLKRLLKMVNPTVKVCGGCALWAIAGDLISNKRRIASQIGLGQLVDLLTVNHERLNFVCSEALGALASELGDSQSHILRVGGVKPLLDVLSAPSCQAVRLSVIHTVAALCMKPALVPNPETQRSIANARGINILTAIVSAKKVSEIIRVEAACALAKLVLNNQENDRYLVRHSKFSYLTVFQFFTSSDSYVRLLGGYCLSVMAFNNSAKIETLKTLGTLNVSNFLPFLDSEDEFLQVHAAFQVVVLSKLLSGVRSADIAVKGIRLLVSLLASDVESIKVQSAEFVASLAHTGGGIPNTLVMAGALENLMANLATGTEPVIENCSVAIGYFTFNPLALRLITGMFRDSPELYRIFKQHFGTIVVSEKFLSNWSYLEDIGLPALSLTIRGGPSITTGRRVHTAPVGMAIPTHTKNSRLRHQTVTFGYEHKPQKPIKEGGQVEMGFLMTRKSSLPTISEGLLPKRHQTRPNTKNKWRTVTRVVKAVDHR